MIFSESTYAVPFPSVDPRTLLRFEFNPVTASIIYQRTLDKRGVQRFSASSIIQSLVDCMPAYNGQSDSRWDSSMTVAMLCVAQDAWLGSVGPQQIASAVSACNALSAIGGVAEPSVIEGHSTRPDRIVVKSPAGMRVIPPAGGLDIARILGWVSVKSGDLVIHPQWGSDGFFAAHTRRRVTRHTIGIDYLKECEAHVADASRGAVAVA